jgi:predicted RND superfamily exporter protein
VIVEGDVDTPEAHNALAASLANLSDTENVLQFGEMAAADSVIGLVGDLADKESPAFDEGVSTAADAAGVGSDGSVSDDADVTALYAAVNAATPERAHVVIHSDGAGGYDALLVNITTQAGEKGAGQLADDVRSAFAPIVDAGLTMVPTSDVIINDVVITAMGNSQLSSLLITVLAAAALLMINFFIESRRPFLGLITIFPVALVMLWAFGLMPALGLAFGPVTATVSALAIGIGVPYMIHITHRFQEDRIRFATSEEAIRSTTTNTGGALAGSAFTTVAGFGILMTASLIPFQQLGLVTGYTILLALVGAVLLLPSMLVIWDRWHKRRGDKPVDPKLALSD